MNDAELKERFETLQGMIEVIAKAVVDNQLLSIRLMCHQQAHLAAIRDLLVKQGEDKTMLNQRLQSAYIRAANLYHDQFAAYQKSGDLKQLLDSLNFPDETQSN